MSMRIGSTPASQFTDQEQFSSFKPAQASASSTDPCDIDADNGNNNRPAQGGQRPAFQGLEKLADDLLHAGSLQEVVSLLKRFLAGAGLTDGADDVAGQPAAAAPGAGGAGTPLPDQDQQDIDFDAAGGGKKTVRAAATPIAEPASPAVPATDGAAQKPAATGAAPSSHADIDVNGGGKNTISVKNTSDREQNYALFTNPTAGMSSSFGRPDGFVTLKPGESANFKLPEQSSGYLQQMNNYGQADYDANKAPEADNFKATRAEYTFNADGSLFFNDSNIDGYNSALKMTANGVVGGSDESVLAAIAKSNPNLIETVGGQQVVRGTQFFTDQTDIEARDALDLALNHNANPGDLNGNTNTYVLPNDDKAVRGTKSNELTLEFGNA